MERRALPPVIPSQRPRRARATKLRLCGLDGICDVHFLSSVVRPEARAFLTISGGGSDYLAPAPAPTLRRRSRPLGELLAALNTLVRC
jgi:hypothetical protein